MSKTPRTDAAIHKFWMGGSWSIEFADFARQLEAENAELRGSLKECVEYAERYEDSGPLGEGWQSKRLVNVCQHARALLARVSE